MKALLYVLSIFIKLILYFFLFGGGRAVVLKIGQNLILDHDVYYNCYIYASFHEHKDRCRAAAELVVGGGGISPKKCYYISR